MEFGREARMEGVVPKNEPICADLWHHIFDTLHDPTLTLTPRIHEIGRIHHTFASHASLLCFYRYLVNHAVPSRVHRAGRKVADASVRPYHKVARQVS